VNSQECEDAAALSEHLRWANCALVVCTRQDTASIEYADALLSSIRSLAPFHASYTYLVANKADVRRGDYDNGFTLEACLATALTHCVPLFEISASDSPTGAKLLLNTILRQITGGRFSARSSSLTSSWISFSTFPPTSRKSKKMKVFDALCRALCAPRASAALDPTRV